MKKLCLLILTVSLFQGCIAGMVMNSQDRSHYSEYVQSVDKLNLEREKAGLKPQTPMTFSEWSGSK